MEQDVTWLDVAMNDAAEMGMAKGAGESMSQPNGRGDRQALVLEPGVERLPLHPVHREVGPAVVRGAVGDVRDDRRMVQPGKNVRLTNEPNDGLRIRGVEELDRDSSSGLNLGRLIDRPHPAARDLAVKHEPSVDSLHSTILRHKLLGGGDVSTIGPES